MDIHFNGFKIKYALIHEYLRPVITSQKIKKVNVFINLDDLFHKLHMGIIDREFQCCGKDASKQLISNIFNLAGHYRNYFVKIGIEPKIFLIYTNANRVFKNSIYEPAYRKHYLNINSKDNGAFYFINSAIKEAIPFLSIISNYIPGVYCINSNYIEPSIVPLYLSDTHKADHNIMISRDEYDLQYSYRTEWSFILPKGDNSVLINMKNLWKYIGRKEKVELVNSEYSPSLFMIMKAISGDKYRNINRLKRCGWKTILNYIGELYNDMGYSSSEIEIRQHQDNRILEQFIANKKIELDTINQNIYVTDIERQVDVLLDTDKIIINNQISDMEDYSALIEMNDMVFKHYPINIAFLTRGVSENVDKKQINYGATFFKL